MTDTKIREIFNGFTNLESIEFKVPMVCLVTGCVSRRRDHISIQTNNHVPVAAEWGNIYPFQLGAG